MRKGLAGLVVVLLVAVGWWLWPRSSSTPTTAAPATASASGGGLAPAGAPGRAQGDRGSAESDAKSSRGKRQVSAADRARRNAMHKKILEAMKAKGRAADEPSEGSSTGSRPEPARDQPELPDTEGEQPMGTEGMTDRTGTHGYLMKAINEEFMPLADECITMAHEQQPALSGMLIVNLELISDEDIGGVVDTIGPGPDNEVPDPDLLECIQESLLSVTLPPPPEGGRDPLSLSMPLTPPEP